MISAKIFITVFLIGCTCTTVNSQIIHIVSKSEFSSTILKDDTVNIIYLSTGCSAAIKDVKSIIEDEDFKKYAFILFFDAYSSDTVIKKVFGNSNLKIYKFDVPEKKKWIKNIRSDVSFLLGRNLSKRKLIFPLLIKFLNKKIFYYNNFLLTKENLETSGFH